MRQRVAGFAGVGAAVVVRRAKVLGQSCYVAIVVGAV